MLQRVKIEGIRFPRLYLAETSEDIQIAKSNGIPFIVWKKGMESFIRALLRPTLEKMFPGINWNKVLGRKIPIRSDVVRCEGFVDERQLEIADYDKDEMLSEQYEYDSSSDPKVLVEAPDEDGFYSREVPVAESQRDIRADRSELGYAEFVEDRLGVYDYIGDISSYVDIDALQKLGLLPKFVGDVADCIKRNLSNSMYWTEGYNKKLGFPLGNFRGRKELPNLIIIDISASIPDGVAATMLTLADTLREQCNADLIITSARSGYYPSGSELPDVQTLRNYYGRSNEGAEFFAILNKYISGREFGHVISFGDDDNPGRALRWRHDGGSIEKKMSNTKIHAVHHYHTGVYCSGELKTGYALWVHECDPNVVAYYDQSWCKVMKDSYRMGGR